MVETGLFAWIMYISWSYIGWDIVADAQRSNGFWQFTGLVSSVYWSTAKNMLCQEHQVSFTVRNDEFLSDLKRLLMFEYKILQNDISSSCKNPGHRQGKSARETFVRIKRPKWNWLRLRIMYFNRSPTLLHADCTIILGSVKTLTRMIWDTD